MPGASFIEREGSWVNEDGRIQRIRRAYRARKGTRDDIAHIAALSGGKLSDRAAAHFDALGAVCDKFIGISYEDVGELGVVAGARGQGVVV